MARAERDRLVDLQKAIEAVESFTAGMTRASFAAADLKTIFAVAWALTVVGEAVKALPRRIRNRHPDVDWAGLAGLRDVLVHQYFRLDRERIWDAIEEDLPPLREAVRQELDASSRGP